MRLLFVSQFAITFCFYPPPHSSTPRFRWLQLNRTPRKSVPRVFDDRVGSQRLSARLDTDDVFPPRQTEFFSTTLHMDSTGLLDPPELTHRRSDDVLRAVSPDFRCVFRSCGGVGMADSNPNPNFLTTQINCL